MRSAVNAVTATGTSCNDSSRRSAVTTISSNCARAGVAIGNATAVKTSVATGRDSTFFVDILKPPPKRRAID